MALIVKTKKQLADEVKAERAYAKRQEALTYLARTDWMVVRFAETGTPIPPDIAEKRAQARKDAS